MTSLKEAASAAERWLEIGRPDEAWEELKRLTPDKGAHPAVLALRVRIFLAKDMLDWAATMATGLVSRVPWSMPARELAAQALERQGLVEEALAMFENAPPAAFKRAVHYFHEGRLLVRLGRVEGGGTRLAKAVEIDPAMRQRILDDKTLEDAWRLTSPEARGQDQQARRCA